MVDGIPWNRIQSFRWLIGTNLVKGFSMQVLERREDGTPKVVELTEAEQLYSALFEKFLDEGLSIFEAKLALVSMLTPPVAVRLTQNVEFMRWLG